MSVNTRIEVVGVKNTINSLRKLDPVLQKQFKTDATSIAQPAIRAAQNVYSEIPLSGMARNWTQRDRKLFPFKVAAARAGVKMRFDTRRNALGVILIEQKNPAAAIFETAGRANRNKLSDNLEPVQSGRTRLIGPAVYRARRAIESEMKHLIAEASSKVQREL